MKHIFMRIVSLLTVLALIVPVIGEFPQSEILVVHAIDDNVDEATLDAQQDCLSASAGNWGKAVYSDGCSWNFFHNEVEEHIVALSKKSVGKEIKIEYNKKVFNPVTKKNTNYGRADLHMKSFDERGKPVALLWDVKPASYLIDPKKSLGEQQLANYTNPTLWAKSTYNFVNGGISTYTAGGTFITEAPSGASYEVKYVNISNGLILYWFKRLEPVPSPDPVPETNPFKNPAEEWGGKPSTVPFDPNNEEDSPKKRLYTFLTTPKSVTNFSTKLVSAVAVMATAITLEKYSSYKPSQTAACLAAGIIDVDEAMEMTEPIFASYPDEYKALEAYVYGEDGADLDDNSSSESSDSSNSGGSSGGSGNGGSSGGSGNGGSSGGSGSGGSSGGSGSGGSSGGSGNGGSSGGSGSGGSTGGSGGSGGGSGSEDALTGGIQGMGPDYDDAGEAQPPRDPLIIDLGEAGIELHSLENGVNFDLDNNSFAEKTAWIGTEDGFLALDRNSNGQIDNGGELFGDQVILKDGSKSKSGFEALAELDDNGDGIIDSGDPSYANLKVWTDVNHNGKSEPNELRTLNEVGVVSISLEHSEISLTDEETGARIAETAEVTINKNGIMSATQISEFWFPVNTSDTTHDGITTAGNVPPLFKAIENDETNELQALCICFEYADDIAAKRYYLKRILYFITDSENIEPNSRGGNIDARDLHVIEQFMGREFVGVGGPNPNVNAAAILKDIYKNIENIYFSIVDFNGEFGNYMNTVYEDTDGSDKKTLNLSIFNYIMGEKLVKGENVNSLIYSLGVYLKKL